MVMVSRVRLTSLRGAENVNVWTILAVIDVRNVALRIISFRGRKARGRHGYPITQLPVKVSNV